MREATGLARQNGVRAGDVLVAVNGQKVGDHEEAKDLIRMAGLEVRLELIRYNEPPPAIRAALEGGTTAPSPAPPPRSPPHSEEGRKLQERLMREGHQANRAGDDAREEGRPEEEVTELYVLSRAKFLECHEAGGRPEPRVSAANMSLKLGDIDGALREYGDMLTQVDRLPPAVAKMVQRKHAETLQLKQQASAQAMVRRLDLDGALPGAEPDDLGAPPTLPPPAPPPPQLKQQASPPHYSTGSAPEAPPTPTRADDAAAAAAAFTAPPLQPPDELMPTPLDGPPIVRSAMVSRRPRRRRRRRRPPRLGKGVRRAVRRRRQAVAGAGKSFWEAMIAADGPLGGLSNLGCTGRARRRGKRSVLSNSCSLKVLFTIGFGARDGGQTPPHGTHRPRARLRSQALGRRVPQLAMSFRQSRVPLPELSSYQHTAKEGSTLPNHAMLEGCVVGGSIYPGESRLSATYPAAATRPGTEPAQSPVRAAHGRRAGAQPNGEADRAPRLAPRPSALAAERRTLSLGGRQRRSAAVSAVD